MPMLMLSRAVLCPTVLFCCQVYSPTSTNQTVRYETDDDASLTVEGSISTVGVLYSVCFDQITLLYCTVVGRRRVKMLNFDVPLEWLTVLLCLSTNSGAQLLERIVLAYTKHWNTTVLR